jgi:SAM-dependent methyltransferase
VENPSELATAHRSWDKQWASEAGRAPWLVPHAEVAAIAKQLRERGAKDVLDLGCGVGRHALFLAREGFAVEALDASAEALAFLETGAAKESLKISARSGGLASLPYADRSFDYVLSWNVIYHGHAGDVAQAIQEIWRVLRPGGLYHGTMLSKRHRLYGEGNEVRPDTFIIENAQEAASDKGHAHFYCDAAALIGLFGGFEVLSLSQDEQGNPGQWHWHVLAEKPGGR